MLLSEPLVVWYANGEWNVLRDVCPHRLVPLSEGRLDEHGQMECGYHGGWSLRGSHAEWECPSCASLPCITAAMTVCRCIGWAFGGDGKCSKIPQGGDPGNPRSCAIAYPCVVRQDLLWVKLVPLSSGSTVNIEDIPIVPEVEVRLGPCVLLLAII